jgi:hypothetical protein
MMLCKSAKPYLKLIRRRGEQTLKHHGLGQPEPGKRLQVFLLVLGVAVAQVEFESIFWKRPQGLKPGAFKVWNVN